VILGRSIPSSTLLTFAAIILVSAHLTFVATLQKLDTLIAPGFSGTIVAKPSVKHFPTDGSCLKTGFDFHDQILILRRHELSDDSKRADQLALFA
jgi:hypothetical protein